VRVREIMTPGIPSVRVTDDAAVAADRMRKIGLRVLPVCGPSGRLVGIITETDSGSRFAAARVGDVMSPDAHYCFEEDDITEAAQLMRQNKVRRLIVLDRQMRPVGMLWSCDLKGGVAAEPAEVLPEAHRHHSLAPQ